MQRSAAEVRARRADTVLISAGVNDLAGVHGPARTPHELVQMQEKLCTALEDAGMRPVVLGPTWAEVDRCGEEAGLSLTADALPEYRSALADWAGRTHRDWVDLWPALEDRPDLLSDGIHPTPAGHEVLWGVLGGTV